MTISRLACKTCGKAVLDEDVFPLRAVSKSPLRVRRLENRGLTRAPGNHLKTLAVFFSASLRLCG